MKILDHTEAHQPTLMRDVYEALVGKEVVIYNQGPVSFIGTLLEYNGHVIHLEPSRSFGTKDVYLPVDKIVAIVEI